MVHSPRSPGRYSLPSQGEPQMCRWAYGVPANMTIVPPSRMTADPGRLRVERPDEHPVRADGDGGTGLVERIGEAVLGGAVEHVDQPRRGVGWRRLPGHQVLDPHHAHRIRAHVRRADDVLVAGDADPLVGAGTNCRCDDEPPRMS